MTYGGIAQLDLFTGLELSNLGSVYRRALRIGQCKLQNAKNARIVSQFPLLEKIPSLS